MNHRAKFIVVGLVALALGSYAWLRAAPDGQSLRVAVTTRERPDPPDASRRDSPRPAQAFPGALISDVAGPAQPRTVRGIVLDKETSAPVVGARVIPSTRDRTAQPPRDVLTGAEGRFTLALPGDPGGDAILIMHQSYAPCERAVGPHENLVHVELVRGRALRGAVILESDHTPVGGARVWLRGWDERTADLDSTRTVPAADSLRPGCYANSRCATTDETGAFEFSGLLGRWFFVTAEADGLRPDSTRYSRSHRGLVRVEDGPLEIVMWESYVLGVRAVDSVTGASLKDWSWAASDARVPMLVSPPPGWPSDARYWFFASTRSQREQIDTTAPAELEVLHLGYESAHVSARPTRLRVGEPPELFVVRLRPTSSRRGSLVVALAPACPHVSRVQLFVSEDRAGGGLAPPWLAGTVDENPTRFELPVGQYRLHVGAVAGQSRREEVVVTVRPDVETEAMLAPVYGGLLLRVVDAAGGPLDGAGVSLLADPETGYFIRLDEGSIRRHALGGVGLHLTEGHRVLAVDRPGYVLVEVSVEVRAGETLTRLVTLEPDRE